MKKHLHILLFCTLTLCTFIGCSSNEPAQPKDYFTLWNQCEALTALQEYVTDVTNPNSANFIAESDRIATFDMDGTFIGELYPTYFEYNLLEYRVLDDTAYRDKAPEDVLETAQQIRDFVRNGAKLPDHFDMKHAQAAAKAYAGMTIEELYDYAVEFGQKNTDSFQNMRYIDGFYLPMVEVVKYLYDNDFTIYVVSGTERTTTRAIVANSPISEYVSPAHVIGTEFEVKQRGYEDVPSNMDYKYADGDDLVFTGGFIQKNLNANKSIWIEREIGTRPVLAFGNSGSDTSMMNYVLDDRNPYPSQAYMVVADDDVREWGTQDWDEKSAAYTEQGYVPISMKNDFVRIYPDTVMRSDEQYVEQELEDAA